MATYSRPGPASRALALDLVLRTFMNSADFNVSNIKIWDNISKLVPGTTPQQCARRWEELLLSNTVVAGDLSGLTATGRPISASRPRKLAKRASSRSVSDQPSPSNNLPSRSEIRISTDTDNGRPHSVLGNSAGRLREEGLWRSISSEDKVWNRMSQQQINEQAKSYLGLRDKQEATYNSTATRGTFTASFCQQFLNKPKNEPQKQQQQQQHVEHQQPKNRSRIPSDTEVEGVESSNITSSVSSTHSFPRTAASPNMIIHVSDDSKKVEKDFVCARDILVREMHYFAEHLSSETQQPWDEVDISVHCDIPVFEWLISYAKQGFYSGPCGEVLTEPLPAPTLTVENIVSILISSEFLQMDKLVEECLVYCKDNLSAVLASPCNMGCINDKLITRLAKKLTPLEVEQTVDKKDKLKSKLFLYHLEQLFKPEPGTAATLYRCKYCKRLLTREQEDWLPCVTQRLSINACGKITYNHEVNPSWNINSYIQSLQLGEGYTPRDLFWRIWSLINMLECKECQVSFQCCELMRCPYHPDPTPCLTTQGTKAYTCCSQPANKFSLVPSAQSGCCYRRHCVQSRTKESKEVHLILLELPDSIYTLDASDNKTPISQSSQTMLLTDCPKINKANSALLFLLHSEHVKTRHKSPLAQESSSSICSEASMLAPSDLNPVSPSSSTTSTGGSSRQQQQQPHAQAAFTGGGSDMEEDEDEGPINRRQIIAATNTVRAKKKACQRQRHYSKGPSHAKEWVWNSKKSRRWNQDMQRESDERRQHQLISQLSLMNTGASKAKEATYAGGIFSRLDAQFRAQQAAKVMSTQPRSHGSRKRF